MIWKKAVSRRSVLRAAGAGAAMLAAPAVLRAQGAQVMKIGTPTINDSQHEWMKAFAALVEKGSEGAIKAELYPASQLGAAPRMIEGAQFGSVQVVVLPPEFLSGVDRRYEVLGAPGVFKDFEHANRTILDPAFNEPFLALGADRGLKGVGLFLNAQMTFNCRTRLAAPGDVAGKKMRVLASEMQTEQVARLGGTAVPMPLGDVLPAVQQGTIDGVLGSLPVLCAMRFYDASPYILDTRHATITVVSVASRMWYDALSPELRAVIDEAGQKASADVYGWAVDFNEAQRKVWTDNGGEIVPLSDADRGELMALMQPIGAEVAAGNADEKALYDLLVKVAGETA